LFFGLLANNVSGSPLIFTVTKEIKTDDVFEISAIDTTKYKQLRIAIKSEKGDSVEYSRLRSRRVELNAQLDSLRLNFKDDHPEVLLKRKEIESLDDDITRLSKFQNAEIYIVAVENGEEIPLFSLDKTRMNDSFLVDTPPTKTNF
jgi:hypothetical protein